MKQKMIITILAVFALLFVTGATVFAREAQPGDDRGRIHPAIFFTLHDQERDAVE